MLTWSLISLTIKAVNTAADSENKIHDDRVAAQFGFRGGLVPGVTVYGYLAEAALRHFGDEWLERGAMDVRFQQPIYHGEEIEVSVWEDGARAVVEIAGRAGDGFDPQRREQPAAQHEQVARRRPRDPADDAEHDVAPHLGEVHSSPSGASSGKLS